VNKLLDHFTLVGPNGSHDCLALELVGPSAADVVELHCKDNRLPSKLAKVFAKQALQGVDFLAANDTGHGGKACIAYVLPYHTDFAYRFAHSKLCSSRAQS
jgi:serine/threonine-protein kinase SRPK3